MFLLMHINAFFCSALICTSIVLEAPAGFSGDFDTHELLRLALKPRAGVRVLWGMLGTAPFERRKLSPVCLGMLGGNAVLMAKW